MKQRFNVHNKGKGNVFMNRIILLSVLSVFGMIGAVSAQDAEYSVGVRNDDQLGLILTDNTGRTLYVSMQDSPYQSNCVGRCQQQWLPILLEQGKPNATPELPGEFGITLRHDGGDQISYNGRPLYVWHKDRVADTKGHGLDKQWFVANVEPTVQLRTDPESNLHLVGPNGMTLYGITTGRPELSGCIDDCAKNWPPLVVGRESVGPQGLGGDFAVVKRPSPDNRLQVTYQGQPLYYWSRDRKPGDTTGNGIGDIWYTIKPKKD